MQKYRVDLEKVSHLFEKKLPRVIISKIYSWVLRVEMRGMAETRKILSLHDEPLKGERKNQRSIRLNKAYRLIYIEEPGHLIVIVKVIEVNKHEY
ncbi:MAG: hypothetical protein HOP07_01135 [Bacteriovoracaceae bacterium]|nr:hypothetical protein [Bacteriovoracaceae bacterium]